MGPGDALATLARDWNVFLFFLGMMALSALAEAAGLFDWLAAHAARLANRSALRLFLNVFALGTLISMILTNDATALVLTPIVYVLVTRLRLPVLPYLFACTFIAGMFIVVKAIEDTGLTARFGTLLLLRKRNIEVSGLDYFKIGIPVRNRPVQGRWDMWPGSWWITPLARSCCCGRRQAPGFRGPACSRSGPASRCWPEPGRS
jgi:Na+/H+ antiporter NhaD/arsenite permease-like protein